MQLHQPAVLIQMRFVCADVALLHEALPGQRRNCRAVVVRVHEDVDVPVAAQVRHGIIHARGRALDDHSGDVRIRQHAQRRRLHRSHLHKLRDPSVLLRAPARKHRQGKAVNGLSL